MKCEHFALRGPTYEANRFDKTRATCSNLERCHRRPLTVYDSPRRTDSSTDIVTRRVDRGAPLLGAPYRRADGTLLCEAIVSKPGVLTYRDAAGKEWRELVPPETLADPDYLAAVGRAVATLEHPEEDVSPDNVQTYQVGDTDGAVEVLEGGYVKARLAVRARKALDAIDAGVEEISPGYNVKLDRTPGTHPEYGRYDAIQIKRELNHIAIVPKGRSGSEVRLRADSAYQVLPTPTKDTKSMEETLKALLEAINAMRADMAANAKKMDEYMASGKKDAPGAAGAGGEGAPVKVEVESVMDEKKMDAEIELRATKRAAIRLAAAQHGVEIKEGTKDLDALRQIAKAIKPEIRADASEDYCFGVIEAAEGRADADDDAYDFMRGEPQGERARGRQDRDDDVDPIEVMRRSNGWRPRTSQP